jgi:DNA-binding NtrC family response regulator
MVIASIRADDPPADLGKPARPENAPPENVPVPKPVRGNEMLVNPPARLLIVEDQPLLALALEMTLQDAGYQVRLAGRVDVALAMLAGERPDAALVDTNLAGESAGPVLDALEAFAVPFALLTGQSTSPLIERVPRPVLMLKPATPEQLLRTISRLLAVQSG